MKNKTVPLIYNQHHRKRIGEFLVCENALNQNHPLHQHDFYEIEYITEGSGIHIINDKSYPVQKGDLLFITPMDFHGFETKDIKTITLHFFAKDMSPEIAQILTYLNADIVKSVNEKTVGDLNYLVRAFKSNCDYAILQIKNVIEIIILDLFGTKAIRYEKKYASDNVSQAIGFINISFRDEITLNIIKEKFNISPAYFSREFKRRTGTSFNDYLTEKRFDYAKKLLKNGNRVIDACVESGFGSVRNFSRRFKDKYGITPKEYARSKKSS
ncbi:MAG: helix-turn-helix domain-containing protein [Clostridia bacterium]|nr:helix-turn-helix domain-containing protein [Clostridia bacterium]